jgi:hypothetical protein
MPSIGVLKNAELTVTARSKATKQFRNHASTWVNGVLSGGNVVSIASLAMTGQKSLSQ